MKKFMNAEVYCEKRNNNFVFIIKGVIHVKRCCSRKGERCREKCDTQEV